MYTHLRTTEREYAAILWTLAEAWNGTASTRPENNANVHAWAVRYVLSRAEG